MDNSSVFQQPTSRRSMQPQPGKSSIYEQNLMRTRGQVSMSAFSFLFSEMVQYCQLRVHSVNDLEQKLEEIGFTVGQRMCELVGYRERLIKRENRVVNMLQYVTNIVWKHMFNKTADNLERSMDNEDEYMIHEYTPITNAFVSVPEDLGSFNCAAFIAGIISGVLNSSNFACKVTAHTVTGGAANIPQDPRNPTPQAVQASPDTTIFLVKFTEECMKREALLNNN